MSSESIYLDYNATTPILPEVVRAMSDAALSAPGNPSSLHTAGRESRNLLESCRERIAQRLGARASEIVFTSGGTEANQLAILGSLAATRTPGKVRHAVVSQIEHPSTLAVYRQLEAAGELSVDWVPADADGRVDPERIATALRSDTAIVSLLHASNETGVVQAIDAVSELCRHHALAFHCDAVQSLGKIEVQVESLGADLVTLSGHKIHGPRGAGALWVRTGRPFVHPWGGGSQERGWRPGTENLAGVAGFATAVEHLEPVRKNLRDRLLRRILQDCPGAVLNGCEEDLVPNTLNVSFCGLSAETLLIRLDLAGVYASSGTACASGAREPSHVLRSMGLDEARVSGAVRFSLGRGTTTDDVDRAGDVVVSIVRDLLGDCD